MATSHILFAKTSSMIWTMCLFSLNPEVLLLCRFFDFHEKHDVAPLPTSSVHRRRGR